jgi:hypothetical protein
LSDNCSVWARKGNDSPKERLSAQVRENLPKPGLYMPGRHPPAVDDAEGRMSHLHSPPPWWEELETK